MTTKRRVLIVGLITGIFIAILVFLPGNLKNKFLSSSINYTSIPTSTGSPTQTMISTSTGSPTDTGVTSSTEIPTETMISSSTESPTETLISTSTEVPTESIIQSSTEAPTETDSPTNTTPITTGPGITMPPMTTAPEITTGPGPTRPPETTLIVPSVGTNSISNITSTTATSGVNIISNGGTAITSNGIVWSTITGPTTALTTKTTNGSGTITGLTANTTYYVRAYATNSIGTSYGNELSFTTSKLPITATLVVSGTTNVGQALVATFSPAGTTATYQWQRSDTATGAYTNVTGATAASYTFTTNDIDKYFKVIATGSGNYTGSVTSNASSKIAAAVDTISPTVVNVTSPTNNGTYKIGTKIPVTLEFSEPVIVVGVPTLKLETGVTDTIALYVSGTGTNTLTFEYTIAESDTSTDLNYVTSTPLSLPTGASIRDNSNNNASLVLPIGLKSLSGNKDLVIDNTRPVTPSRPIVVNKTGIIATSTGEMVDVTDNNEVTFTVSCLTGGTATLYNDVQVLATVPCKSTSIDIPVTLSQFAKLYYITSSTSNAAGTISYRSPSVVVMKRDSFTNATPGIPDLVSSDDLGQSSIDNITSKTQPRITLTCTSGSTVNLYDGTTLIGTTPCVASTAQIVPLQPLSNSIHILTAKQSTAAGTTSLASSALTLTIDTTPLTVVLAVAAEQSEPATSSTIKFTATFSKTIDSYSFNCSDIKVTNGVCKNVTLLSGNIYMITVTATAPGQVKVVFYPGGVQTVAGTPLKSEGTGINTVTYMSLNSAPSQSKTTVDGQCSTLKQFYTPNPTSKSLDGKTLCSQGTVVRVVYSAQNRRWDYACRGENGGTNAVCAVNLTKTMNSAPVTEDSCKSAELPLDKCVLGNKKDMFTDYSYLSCLNIVPKKASCKEAGCNNSATRKTWVYIVDRMRGILLGDAGYQCQKIFKDTTKGWICEAAEKAQVAGLISSKNSSFGGDNTITRAEAYAMALSSACIKIQTASKNWQTNVINTAREHGFTVRTVADFEAKRSISLGEISALAVRVIQWKTENPDSCAALPESLVCEM